MRRIIIIWLAVVSVLEAACSSNLSQSPVSTIQPQVTERVVPATVMVGEAVPYEIVASGDPTVGTGQNSAAVAWRPGTEAPAMLTAFPDEARAALKSLRTQDGSDLYLAVYGGRQPSSGYEVKIVAVDKRDGQLQVTYQIAGPPPGQGAATVMTHPYVIVRLTGTTVQPADVIFVEQKGAR